MPITKSKTLDFVPLLAKFNDYLKNLEVAGA
jgi:hypothetical protein